MPTSPESAARRLRRPTIQTVSLPADLRRCANASGLGGTRIPRLGVLGLVAGDSGRFDRRERHTGKQRRTGFVSTRMRSEVITKQFGRLARQRDRAPTPPRLRRVVDQPPVANDRALHSELARFRHRIRVDTRRWQINTTSPTPALRPWSTTHSAARVDHGITSPASNPPAAPCTARPISNASILDASAQPRPPAAKTQRPSR